MEHPNALDQQLENLRTLQQSYDQIAEAAEAYNTGKVELAENLEFKGVQASASETLPTLAAKVRDIAQTTTEIVGGEMYGAQLFGDANPAQSPLWNLYDVLAEMKTRFMGAGQYAALIVCEYYKGYDSLQLQGADAYYTCDGDLYETSMPLHVWHDADNGRTNRWVCFLFATDGARLNITNTAISPRSMYIGGHIGTIEYFVNGRLTDLVCGVEDTDVVDNFLPNSYSQSFNRTAIIRNIKNISKFVVNNNGGTVIIDGLGEVVQSNNASTINTDATSLFVSAESITCTAGYDAILLSNTDNVSVRINGNASIQNTIYGGLISLSGNYKTYLTEVIKADGFTGGRIINFGNNCNLTKLIDLEVGALKNNLSLALWIPDYLDNAGKKAQLIENIKNHILARVSDATGGTQLVFTVSTNMYNAIASEQIEWQGETMTLADAFLTKNWRLAGA